MFKKILKRAARVLLVLLIIIQFFRPERNVGGDVTNDITKRYPVPDSVQRILRTSCYDCHSNRTDYPWYANIQPVGWWLQHHINEGKRGLNFSEFSTYRIAKQYNRFEKTTKLIKENEMPLNSYLLIHRYAILSDSQKQIIMNWADALHDSIKANYPRDSLIMPKRKKV